MGPSFEQEPTTAAPTSLRNGSRMSNDFVLSREGLGESRLPLFVRKSGDPENLDKPSKTRQNRRSCQRLEGREADQHT